MTKLINISKSAAHSTPAAMREALRDGVFFVENPVPKALFDEVYGLLDDFFGLPLTAKMSCQVPGANGQTGYTPALTETAERSRQPDWKELFHWGRALPPRHPLRERYPARYPDPVLPDALVPGIGSALSRLHGAMLDLQLAVMDVVGDALGIAPGYFREMLADGPVVNRAAWYPPISGAPSRDCVWAVEHQDFDLITALPQATSGGLEVLIDDAWSAATPPDGCAVIMAGMVLERLTGGTVPAVFHRVAAASGQESGRLSIVQFCHPAPWTVLTPLGLSPGTGPATAFPTLTAGDLFDRTMYRINRMDSAREAPGQPATGPFTPAAMDRLVAS
jgi:isopenicillin N synthase-like dioxygenase